MASLSKTIQSEVETEIESILLGTRAIVMSRLRGHISNNIAAAIAQKKIVVMCFPPTIGGIKQNVFSHTRAEDCRMQLRIVEEPKLNSLGIDAYEVVERILSINGFKTSGGTQIFLDKVESTDPDNVNVVEFIIELKMQISFPRIQRI